MFAGMSQASRVNSGNLLSLNPTSVRRLVEAVPAPFPALCALQNYEGREGTW